MNFYFIENYIANIKKEDIQNFAIKQNIILDNNELNNIYYYIKNNYKNIIYDKPEVTLLDIKNKFNNDTYVKIERVYLKFKDKIDKFIKYKR